MDDQPARVTWMARINIRPPARDEIHLIAKAERMSIATVLGLAIETYVTARSTA